MLRKLYRNGRYNALAQLEQLQHNLIVAGLPGGLTVTDFLGLRFLMKGAVFLRTGRRPYGDQPADGPDHRLFGCRFPRRRLYVPNFWLRSKGAGAEGDQPGAADAGHDVDLCGRRSWL